MHQTLTPAPRAVLPSDHEIISKARILFADRKVTALAAQLLARSNFLEWVSHVLDVQKAIYLIDAHFEDNPQVKLDHVERLWSRVHSALSRPTVLIPDFCWEELHHLRRYQLVEERIHEFDVISPLEFNLVLQLKASDVSMARRLIWSHAGRDVSSREMLFWRAYDEASELLEDIRDIDEDIGTWNFNFWTYHFMAGGRLLDGTAEAWRLLNRRLYEVELLYSKMALHEQRRACIAYAELRRHARLGLERVWSHTLQRVVPRLTRYADIVHTPIYHGAGNCMTGSLSTPLVTSCG